MAGDREPKRRGWYPHRFGDEGMQSYWNGSEWTGKSRPKPSLSLSPRSAFGWVVLAIGINLVGGLISPGEATTALDWVFWAASTAAWVLAAINARQGVGRVLLWLIAVGNVFLWLFGFGLLVVA